MKCSLICIAVVIVLVLAYCGYCRYYSENCVGCGWRNPPSEGLATARFRNVDSNLSRSLVGL